VRQILTEQAPDIGVKLVEEEEGSAILTERDGEPVVISTVDEEDIEGARVVFLTGSPDLCARSLELVERLPVRPAIIDLTYLLEQREDVALRAPLVDAPPATDEPAGAYLIAHPAAIVLAEFLTRLHRTHPVRRSLVHAFEPASERGKKGVVELQQQTVNLLSFKSLPQEVFDTQLAFSLLPRYGSAARVGLDSIEAMIVRQLGTLLERAGGVPPPSLRLVQAPVFHGHSFSVWIEFKKKAEPRELIKALASDRIEVRGPDEQPASNVGVTGQGGMIVGRVERDRNNPRAAWFWIAADNHRVAAENAVRLAQLLAPVEGSA